MWNKIKGWMRSHWKTVAAISLAILAALVVGAICATPVGAPIVAAVASIKIFAAIATMSPIWIPFVMGGLAAAATLTLALLFNAATFISNWLDKTIDKKSPGGSDSPDYRPLGSVNGSRRSMSKLGANRTPGKSSEHPGSDESFIFETPGRARPVARSLFDDSTSSPAPSSSPAPGL